MLFLFRERERHRIGNVFLETHFSFFKYDDDDATTPRPVSRLLALFVSLSPLSVALLSLSATHTILLDRNYINIQSASNEDIVLVKQHLVRKRNTYLNILRL